MKPAKHHRRIRPQGGVGHFQGKLLSEETGKLCCYESGSNAVPGVGWNAHVWGILWKDEYGPPLSLSSGRPQLCKPVLKQGALYRCHEM